MAQPHHHPKEAAAIITPLDPNNNYTQEVEEEKGIPVRNGNPSIPPSLRVPPPIFYLLGDVTHGSAYRFAEWLESVRKRSGMFRSSGFPNRPPKLESAASRSLSLAPQSAGEPTSDSCSSSSSRQTPEISLWERLGRAAMLDIESNEFSWSRLSSLHHTEHSSSAEQCEDEIKALEVTVNSGGVVFFALFNRFDNGDPLQQKEAAAVVKVSSSRMATQSERLGYELAKWLRVRTPQARVIHNSSSEWQDIKEAAEKAREVAVSEGDEAGELTCSELLEALEMSRCLLLMNYVHGSPLSETPNAFNTKEAAERTASALGRILLLDLVIRNEDRLPCRQLGWRGNSANLLFADKLDPAHLNSLEEAFDSSLQSFRPRVIRSLEKERRCISVDSKLGTSSADTKSQSTNLFIDKGTHFSVGNRITNELKSSDSHIVAIDSGVPRRPPAGKRNSDQTNFPKLVELLINSFEYSSNLLHEISGGKMGSPETEEAALSPDSTAIVNEFRTGFRGALRDLQGFHLFLLTVHQKLDSLLRSFITITSKSSSGDFEKDESGIESAGLGIHYTSPVGKERNTGEIHAEAGEPEVNKAGLKASFPCRESPEAVSPLSREHWCGKQSKGGGDPRSLRLTMKLRDFNKYAKVDAELARELDQWNEMLRTDAVRLCQENNFNTGFFEGNDNNSVVDAYELKVRLEHILERITLISDAANTERPSMITSNLFIGGALAARSVHTLQYLGITHILCLCSNEIGQADSQFPDIFVYKNFSIYDHEDAKISSLFGEASDFIGEVERLGKKVLVHCFEGKSRSATVVLTYLMLKKNYTLLEAWNSLKRVHRRAQPNDGFARCLLDLDKKLHGKASMEWQQRRPTMKVCPLCGKNTGLSTSSLNLHLQKSHKKISSGSMDSAMTMEIKKALSALKISRSNSVSPTQKEFSIMDGFDQ